MRNTPPPPPLANRTCFSGHHQMSLWGRVRSQVWCPRGSLPCDLSHDAFDSTPPRGQTDVSENITFLQIRLRAVKTKIDLLCSMIAITRVNVFVEYNGADPQWNHVRSEHAARLEPGPSLRRDGGKTSVRTDGGEVRLEQIADSISLCVCAVTFFIHSSSFVCHFNPERDIHAGIDRCKDHSQFIILVIPLRIDGNVQNRNSI